MRRSVDDPRDRELARANARWENPMVDVTRKNGSFSVRAYRGDAKTLLAFNLAKAGTKNLAGFTIQCEPN